MDGKDICVVAVRVQVEGLKGKGCDVDAVNVEDEVHVADNDVVHNIGHDAVHVEISSLERIVDSDGIASNPRGIVPCPVVDIIWIWMEKAYRASLADPPGTRV